MPGSIQYIGRSPNTQAWLLDGLTGYEFEELLYGTLAATYSTDRDNIRIVPTPKSGDEGKDIIIKARRDLEIFGVPLSLRGKEEITVYVECKSTTQGRVRLNSFGKNFLQTREDDFDYFVLATNGTITPHAFYVTHEAFKAEGIEFIVVDEYRLRHYLNTQNVSLRLSFKEPVAHDDIVIEYQTGKREIDDTIAIDIFLWVRNYTDSVQPCRLFLQSDTNWSIRQPDRTFFLDPFASQSFKIRATREYNDGRQQLRIGLKLNETFRTLTIAAKTLMLDFVPRLFGIQHHAAIRQIVELLDENQGLSIVSITGEAGTGKSRVVDEIIERRQAGNIKYVRTYFENGNPEKSLKRFVAGVDRAFGTTYLQSVAEWSLDEALVHIVEDLHSDFFSAVFIFEDLHHGDESICQAFKSLLSAARNARSPLCIILTGRNDFTFPNDNYFSLLDLIKFHEAQSMLHYFELTALSDRETRDLIRSTIENIPTTALDKIHQISMNVPFNVMQCVEYLLETELVKIKNRNTVGIPNIQKFAANAYIPDSMEDIFRYRLRSLETLSFGEQIKDFLFIAAFFGFQIPLEVKDLAFDGLPQDPINAVLTGRRFIKNVAGEAVQWYHENLLLFFSKLLEENGLARRYANYLLNRPALFLALSPLDRGKVACLAGNYELSLDYLRPITDAITRIDNFSSENLEAHYFKYLRYVFQALWTNDPANGLLVKVILAQAYMGVHNLPLLQGVAACREARAKLPMLALEDDEREVLNNSIKQLEAHAHMNIGWIRQAKKAMLEIECRIQLSPVLQAQHDLKFDLYNRLQDLYRYYNHLLLAEDYGKLAEIEAVEATNPKLMAVHLIGTAVLYTYRDLERCLRLSKEAFDFTMAHGTERHQCLAELGLRATELARYQRDREKLQEISDCGLQILEMCIANNYASAIPRVYLLLATSYFLLGLEDPANRERAKRFVELGINASVKYGVGHYIWQLYNMSAILSAYEKQPAEVIFKQFNTAIDYIRSADLLFVGNGDFCCANLIVISNFILFLDRYDTEESVYDFLRTLRFYRDNEVKTKEDYISMMETVRQNRVLFQHEQSPALLFDETTGYSLSVF